MSKSLNLLILTDHRDHSAENSLYAFGRAFRAHSGIGQLDVATRTNPLNHDFFSGSNLDQLQVAPIDAAFSWSATGEAFAKTTPVSPSEYDVIWLRLPPPLDAGFLAKLSSDIQEVAIFNKPENIIRTGSKAFLLNFPALTPPLCLCRTAADVREFAAKFPIVLKPLRDYGGKGIIKVEGTRAWRGKEEIDLNAFLAGFGESLPDNEAYLGVKFLNRVSEGDKRIVVVAGKVMGASLRIPAADSWLCNVSAGGTSTSATVTPKEYEIAAAVAPELARQGIIMYGLDTLVGDDGQRVLSEINTTSIGGLPQIAAMDQKPLVEEAVKLLYEEFQQAQPE